ncbi:hypothetical protein [Streptomyces sp. KR55]|uniref:hypothetical protein n=1 Tax=Streptomyces sp. KR55 TaxID=3457425 RepID=UPI003FD2AC07
MERSFALAKAAAAHRLGETNHTRGKLVLTVTDGPHTLRSTQTSQGMTVTSNSRAARSPGRAPKDAGALALPAAMTFRAAQDQRF